MRKDALYYLQKGVRKIQNILNNNGTEHGPVAEQPERSVEEPVTDYTAWQLDVRDGMIRQLPSVIRSAKDCPNRILHVFVSDGGRFGQAVENGLEAYLADWIEYKKGYVFAAVVLHEGIPSASLLQAEVNPVVRIAVERKDARPFTPVKTVDNVPVMAVITVLDGCCTLKDGATTLTGIKEQTWNIGFGEFNNFGGRKVRYNQIALQYANPEGRVKDPYPVSRAHAHITYKPGRGFFFYVDPRGQNKRTAVQKGEKVHKVTNVMAGIMLEDGDIIILNRVMLLFKSVQEEL